VIPGKTASSADLVVVANTQMRTLRTEVGKVPCETAVGHG